MRKLIFIININSYCILQIRISGLFSFATRLTDDFDTILREIESMLVLGTSVDELTNKIDDLVTIQGWPRR